MRLETIEDPAFLRQAATVLESENRKLIGKVLELTRRVRELEGKPEQMQMELDELAQQLAVHNRLIFGDKSEKRPRTVEDDSEPNEPQRGHGPKEQPSLPTLETAHKLDEADQTCPSCGGELEAWEGQSEDSEEIESIQRCFVIVKHKRQKYRCKCGGCVETAPGPKKLIAGGRYAPSVAVAVAVDKYADHLPLERQARIMSRQGLAIDSQTLWDQINALARHLWPAYERLHQYVLSHDVLGADETPWKLMEKAGKSSQRWYAWALCARDAVIYRLDESRSAEAAKKVLLGFGGTLVCDGYTAYQSLKKQGAPFAIAHCWAHVRRKFVEAKDSSPGPCDEVLDMIGKLYEIERDVRDGPPQARLLARQTQSKSILADIHRWALTVATLPQSPLGKAIGYMTSLWPGLQVFLHDARVDLDNNAVERVLRGVVTLVSLCTASVSARNHKSAIILNIATRAPRAFASAA